MGTDFLPYSHSRSASTRNRSKSCGGKGNMRKGKGKGKPMQLEMQQQGLNIRGGATIPLIDLSKIETKDGVRTVWCNFRNNDCDCSYCKDRSDTTSVQLIDGIKRIFSDFSTFYLPDQKIKEMNEKSDDGNPKKICWRGVLFDQNSKGVVFTKYMESVANKNGGSNLIVSVTMSVICENYTMANAAEAKAPWPIMSLLASGIPNDDFAVMFVNKFREYYSNNGVHALSILQNISSDDQTSEDVNCDVFVMKTGAQS